MASTEKVVQLFEVLTLWERLVEFREDMLRQLRESSESSEQYSLLMIEARTEDWPDATYRTLIAAYREILSDKNCLRYIELQAEALDEIYALAVTLQSQMSQFWLFRSEQLVQDGMNYAPPPPSNTHYLH